MALSLFHNTQLWDGIKLSFTMNFSSSKDCPYFSVLLSSFCILKILFMIYNWSQQKNCSSPFTVHRQWKWRFLSGVFELYFLSFPSRYFCCYHQAFSADPILYFIYKRALCKNFFSYWQQIQMHRETKNQWRDGVCEEILWYKNDHNALQQGRYSLSPDYLCFMFANSFPRISLR